jgi:hypothetical protein
MIKTQYKNLCIQLVYLYTYCNRMHGAYNVKYLYYFSNIWLVYIIFWIMISFVVLCAFLYYCTFTVWNGFLKTEKATISFVTSVCQHGTTRLPPDRFSWNLIFEYLLFRKAVENSLVALKSHMNNGYCTWQTLYIFIISRSFLLITRNISDQSCRENQNTHFKFNYLFFPPRISRYLLDNVGKYSRAGKATEGNMAHAHCMLDTHG